jgi:hypothetical protein
MLKRGKLRTTSTSSKKQSAIFVDVSQIMTGFARMTVDDVNRERESCLQISWFYYEYGVFKLLNKFAEDHALV